MVVLVGAAVLLLLEQVQLVVQEAVGLISSLVAAVVGRQAHQALVITVLLDQVVMAVLGAVVVPVIMVAVVLVLLVQQGQGLTVPPTLMVRAAQPVVLVQLMQAAMVL